LRRVDTLKHVKNFTDLALLLCVPAVVVLALAVDVAALVEIVVSRKSTNTRRRYERVATIVARVRKRMRRLARKASKQRIQPSSIASATIP